MGCERTYDWTGEGYLDYFEVVQGFYQGCVLAPLLFNIFITAGRNITEGRFRVDPQIEADLMNISYTFLAVGNVDETPWTSTE